MHPQNLIKDLQDHLRALNYSPQTIQSRTYGLRVYLNHLLNAGIPPAEAKWQDIQSFQASLMESSRARSTIQCIMVSVRALYKHFADRGLRCDNPATLIPLPRAPFTLPRGVMTTAEISRILRQPNIKTDTGVLHRSILETAYGTGMRRSEICSLRLDDIGIDTITVRQGKGAKDRVIPLGREALRWIETYRDTVRTKLTAAAHDAPNHILFLGICHRKRINPKTINDMFKRYARQAGITRRVTFHSLRHAFATHLLQGGAGIIEVSRMLGHESITTTQRYVEVTASDLCKAHANFHPRG